METLDCSRALSDSTRGATVAAAAASIFRRLIFMMRSLVVTVCSPQRDDILLCVAVSGQHKGEFVAGPSQNWYLAIRNLHRGCYDRYSRTFGPISLELDIGGLDHGSPALDLLAHVPGRLL